MVNTIVALDIGTTRIRGIEAQIKKGSLPKIIKINSIALESQIMESGLIKSETLLTNALKKLWSTAKFSSKVVVTMATGEAYDNRVEADLPWSPEADFKKVLPHYLKERLPYDPDEYYFDSHTLNEYYKDDPNDDQLYKKVLVAGVNREFTESLIKAIEAAGLRPASIDMMPLALIRSYSLIEEPPQDATIVSIELGGDVTTIVIHQNSQPVYINTAAPLGGVRVTNEIARELGITLAEAEILKTSFSLPPEEANLLVANNVFEDGTTRQTPYSKFDDHQKEQTKSIISREVSNLIMHISDIIEDAFSSRIESPAEIVLSGGGAGLFSLASRVQTELNIPVKIAKPFGDEASPKIDPDVFKNQHIYASIAGLLVTQNEF